MRLCLGRPSLGPSDPVLLKPFPRCRFVFSFLWIQSPPLRVNPTIYRVCIRNPKHTKSWRFCSANKGCICTEVKDYPLDPDLRVYFPEKKIVVLIPCCLTCSRYPLPQNHCCHTRNADYRYQNDLTRRFGYLFSFSFSQKMRLGRPRLVTHNLRHSSTRDLIALLITGANV